MATFTKLEEIIGSDGIIQGIRFEGSSNYVNVKNTIISRRREAKTRLEWEIVGSDAENLRVQNLKTGAGVVIPREVLRPAARTPSGLRQMGLDDPYDYVVNDRFPNDEFFWDERSPENVLAKRQPHLISRQGKLLIAGRNHVGVTSPGTYWIAFASETDIVPTWSFWSVKIDNPEDAKIICLWLNSVFSLATLYDCRIIGTGAYVGWLKPDLLQLYVPDVKHLEQDTRRALLELFDAVNSEDMPPLITQLRTADERRLEMDLKLANLLGITKYSNRDMVIELYRTVAERFSSLEELQKG